MLNDLPSINPLAMKNHWGRDVPERVENQISADVQCPRGQANPYHRPKVARAAHSPLLPRNQLLARFP
jgi:hypothetical protein